MDGPPSESHDGRSYKVRVLRGSCEVLNFQTGALQSKATQPFAALTLLIARRASAGGDVVTTSEFRHQMIFGKSPPQILSKLKDWQEDCWINQSDSEGSYVCTLASEEVDVIHLFDRATHYLDNGIEHDDFLEVRQLLDLYHDDPTRSMKGFLRADEGHVTDPFANFKSVMHSFYELAIEKSPNEDMRRAFVRKYEALGGTVAPALQLDAGRELADAQPVPTAMRLLSALGEIGVSDVLGDLGGTFLDPEVLLESVEHSIDFIGHTASKFRLSSNFETMLERLEETGKESRYCRVRFLLSGESLDGQPELTQLKHLRRSYPETFEFRLYRTHPLLRVTHVDNSWIAIQTYPKSIVQGGNWELGALVFGTSGVDTFYHAFVTYFETMWKASNS